MVKKILLSALSLLVLLTTAAAKNNDIELLRNRFKTEAMSQPVQEERVRQLMDTLQPDGTWPGIDYADTARIAFQHVDHLNNLVAMALAYKKDSSTLKGNKGLKKKFDLALDHWLDKDYICENWWNNQIGTPTTMVHLLYIMDKDLSKEQVAKMLEIAGRANMNASGARPSGDRAKIASILAQTQLWCRNDAEVENVLKIIEGEVKFAGEESSMTTAEGKAHPNYFAGGRGMQRDFSFHHRPDRVNNTSSYGTGYLGAIIDWAVKVSDTKYRFSDKTVHTIVDYFLDGMCKQMVYGTMVDPGVRNRDIARPSGRGAQAAARRAGEKARPLRGNAAMPENLLKIAGGYRQAELEEIVAARNGDHSHTPSFAKFFWQTEHFAFQRPGFYTSVRMFSSRNKSMEEPYNGEGLTNHYRADGTNYLSVSGDEYTDIYAVYDFRKIPGTTVMQAEFMPPEGEIQQSGVMDFVGGVTDGLYGAVAFDFISPIDPLQARKSWFFFDDGYLCLGSGIRSRGQHPVFTTLNQCYLRGEVLAGLPGSREVLETGEHALDRPRWILHDQVGYAFLDAPAQVGVMNQSMTGSWQRLNRQTTVTRKPVHADIFSLWIDHGSRVSGGHYAYAVLPHADAERMETFSAHPDVEIVSNTRDLQAVWHPGLGLGYAVFYGGGTVQLGGVTLSSDTPLMVLVRVREGQVEKICVSDPSRKLLKAHLSVNGREMHVALPQGEYAGESITI
ncbi:MAG: hypothetical protein IJ654_06635 [Bacteroidales bacterium]|nr:hypothetical protein [Bacteroidales bacterium]